MFFSKTSRIERYLEKQTAWSAMDYLLYDYVNHDIERKLSGLGMRRLEVFVEWNAKDPLITVQGKYDHKRVDIEIEREMFSIGRGLDDTAVHTFFALESREQFYFVIEDFIDEM